MDTFFAIFKTIGDYILTLLCFYVSACSISKTFKAWFTGTERAIKKTRSKQLIFGISLAVFGTMYIAASISVKIVQLKQQTPIYLRQITLKHDAEKLVKDMVKYADNWPTNSIDRPAYWQFRAVFDRRFQTIATDLDNEGQHSPDFEQGSEFLRKYNEDPMGFNADLVRRMANTIQALAEGLPTPQ